jgi:hypothetical protein
MELGVFKMNEITHDDVNQLKEKIGRKVYRKKPIEIEAYQMNEDFQVKTLEGTMQGKKGDYVIIGIRKELYICDNEIFHSTYDFVRTEEL